MFQWLMDVIQDHIVRLYPELSGQTTFTDESRALLEQYGFKLVEDFHDDGTPGLRVLNTVSELMDIHDRLDVELEAQGLTEI